MLLLWEIIWAFVVPSQYFWFLPVWRHLILRKQWQIEINSVCADSFKFHFSCTLPFSYEVLLSSNANRYYRFPPFQSILGAHCYSGSCSGSGSCVFFFSQMWHLRIKDFTSSKIFIALKSMPVYLIYIFSVLIEVNKWEALDNWFTQYSNTLSNKRGKIIFWKDF